MSEGSGDRGRGGSGGSQGPRGGRGPGSGGSDRRGGERRAGGSSDDRGRGRPDRSGGPSGDRRGGPGGRDAAGRAGGARDGAGREGRGREGREGGGRGRAGSWESRERRTPAERTAEQAIYDGPEIPEEITGQELDRSVLAQLRGLPEKLASRVARHLVAAGALMDTDPEVAYKHALAARARAARVAVVREATGEAAYAAGHFAEALSELRAARRMNGAQDYLPVMADCERALGRPERALELARNPAVADLPTEQRIEMTLVEAGARADLGEIDSALRTLEHAPIRSVAREPWVVRLRYAYADLLLRAGRREDALVWFHRTAGIDGDEATDAMERIAELEGGAAPER